MDKDVDVAIIGGGPGGYEAALVAAGLGASVALVERDGCGGQCVLGDCIPSKALIAASRPVGGFELAEERLRAGGEGLLTKITALVRRQSHDVRSSLYHAGVEVFGESGTLLGGGRVRAGELQLQARTILVATGAAPRLVPGAEPDGTRVLTWRDLYTMEELPERLIVVGSGVTGAEFAGAYADLGSSVVLVSSREQVLPSEDSDAAGIVQRAFEEAGVEIVRGRAAGAVAVGEGVEVSLTDGRVLTGSHVLMCVGSVPNTAEMGLDEAGVELTQSGHVKVDRVSRTSAPGIYAAGDVTGVLPLASVAAMQGRIAMWHALGEAVAPLETTSVASAVFVSPEVASVGVSQAQVESGAVAAESVMLNLASNARAKMEGIEEGFVKIFSQPSSGVILGAVVVAPGASELITPLSLAVAQRTRVEELAHTFGVYPSLSGSIIEASRRLMRASGR